MFKKIMAVIFSLAILAGCTPNTGTEISETVSETAAAVSEAVTTAVFTETSAETAAAEEKSLAENIKEALKAEWNDDVNCVQIYAEDLNGDGVKELFVNYSVSLSNERGVTYVFDVSNGVKKLYEISARTAAGDIYADESGTPHYIIREKFPNYVKVSANFTDVIDTFIYFDISYDSIEMPFYGERPAYGDVSVYKNCKVMPTNAKTHTNFNKSSAEFVKKFNEDDFTAAWKGDAVNEASEVIQEAVFDGLTYVSEPKGIYVGSYLKGFEEFWQDAEPRIGPALGYKSPDDTSCVDFIKEALQAEWDESVSTINLYTADLNGDGVKELFVNYSYGAAMNGFVYVYDVSDGAKKLCEMPARIWAGSSGLYADGDGKTHFILENSYASTSSSEMDYAVFDITYDELKQPLFADVYDWYDGGAHVFEYDLYKNCEIVPDARVFDGERCFSSDKAEYIGRYDQLDTLDAFDGREENEVREIIQKEVYEGLTYVSDIEEIYKDSWYTTDRDTTWDAEYFWQGAAPVLAEIYGTKPVPQSMADLGVNPDGTLNDKFTERLKELATPDGPVAMGIFPALWDFDGDGIPEMILIFHSGGQDNMPCKVYNSESLEQIGEFEGFCRDGFTRFTNGYDVGTAIYSYYEHSNWRRMETVEFVHMEQGKLVSDKKITRIWQTGDNMIKPAMVVYSDNSEELNGLEKDFLGWKFGDVCTSYDNFDIDGSEFAAAAVESYNNYIRVYNITKEEYPVGCAFIGPKNEAAVYEIKGEGFFRDENGTVTPLNNDLPYTNIYKLNEDIIVCDRFGNSQPSDVYIITDGKPVLDEKISGQGHVARLSRSSLYNEGFEMIDSVYDMSTYSGHTFKPYQLYRDENGFHEYGSIIVPVEDFNKYYGEAAQPFIDEIAEEWRDDPEIYEVLYRGDGCFILNLRSPLKADDYDSEIFGYNYYNITFKPTADNGLADVYRDFGFYKTALIPEIAVYPEKMYTPENN